MKEWMRFTFLFGSRVAQVSACNWVAKDDPGRRVWESKFEGKILSPNGVLVVVELQSLGRLHAERGEAGTPGSTPSLPGREASSHRPIC